MVGVSDLLIGNAKLLSDAGRAVAGGEIEEGGIPVAVGSCPDGHIQAVGGNQAKQDLVFVEPARTQLLTQMGAEGVGLERGGKSCHQRRATLSIENSLQYLETLAHTVDGLGVAVPFCPQDLLEGLHGVRAGGLKDHLHTVRVTMQLDPLVGQCSRFQFLPGLTVTQYIATFEDLVGKTQNPFQLSHIRDGAGAGETLWFPVENHLLALAVELDGGAASIARSIRPTSLEGGPVGAGVQHSISVKVHKGQWHGSSLRGPRQGLVISSIGRSWGTPKFCCVDELLHRWEAGGHYDSSGQIGVDSLRASQLLGQYRLAQPEFYLVKLVQALVAAGSRQVSLEVSSRYLRLESGPLSSSPRQGPYLAVGLAGLLAQQPEQVELCLGVAGEGLRWQADSQRWQPVSQTSQGFRLICRGQRQVAKETEIVRERCQWAPVPIALGGQLVNVKDWRAGPSKTLANDGNPLEQRRGFHLCERYQLEPDSPNQGLAATRVDGGSWLEKAGDQVVNSLGTFLRQVRGSPGEALVQFHRLPTSVPFQRISRATPPCSQILVVTAGLEGPSTVQVIKDGVALNAREEELAVPGCVVLLSGRGLEADLSGFQVVQNDAYRLRLEQVAQELKEMLGDIQRWLPKLRLARRMSWGLGLVHPLLLLAVFGELASNAMQRGPLEAALRSRLDSMLPIEKQIHPH